jgi:colicin import membrane protein
MKAVAVLVLGCVLGPALGLAQEAAGPNVISQVKVKGHTVEITGSAQASFNTFTLAEPTRLVIDISEAVFSGVPAEVPVEGGGVVAGVQTLSDSEEGTPIARVVIGFSQEVETDIEARGTLLVVSVAEPGGSVEVARAPEPVRPAPPADTAVVQPPGTRVAAASTPAEQAMARTTAEEKQREAQARLQAEARATAEEKKREAQARLQAEREEQQRREAEARAAAEGKKREAQARRQAEREEKQRREAEARAAAEVRTRELEARRQAEREGKRKREAETKVVRVARAEQPERPAQERDEEQAASSRRKAMTLVGFRQESGVARVFIRTDEPVRYSLSREGSLVVVELENTRIGQGNNTRRLDTSFFQTAVSSVEPRPDSSGRSVQVAIRLKQPVPYKTRQEGNEVSIEFSALP